MWPATWSSYPSRHKVRASNTTSSRGLRSGISFSCGRYEFHQSSSGATARRVGQGMAEQTGRVLAAHGPQLVLGEMAPHLSHQLLGVGPRAVAVRVVGLEHDVVDPDAVAGVDGRGVVERAEPEVALQQVGGADVPAQAVARAVDDVVEPVEEHGHPPDAALGHGDLQLGVADRPPGPQPFRTRGQRQLAEQRGAERQGRRPGRVVGDARRADVQADHRLGLGARLDDRLPVLVEERRETDAVGPLGQGHRGEAAGRVAADLRARPPPGRPGT